MLSALYIAGLLLTTPQEAPPPPAPPPAGAEKKLCRSIVPTGSTLPRRFCLTRTEWRRMGEITGANADRFLGRRMAGMCDVGPAGCR